MNIQVPYGITRRLAGVSLADARARTVEALKAEGFGVLTEIDLQATLKQKIGVEMEPYVILGACNPKLAHAAIQQEPGVGLLLPCNVVVAQDGADAIVSAASSRAMFRLVEGVTDVASFAEEAEARLQRAIQAL
jgi:uncharacterized protein (DUF302 family)